jgi:carotenoid cleavage dioxygenase-like enzyme
VHYRARIGVFRRDGHDDDVRWLSVKPCVISHVMNAIEDGDVVVFDVIRAERLQTPLALD